MTNIHGSTSGNFNVDHSKRSFVTKASHTWPSRFIWFPLDGSCQLALISIRALGRGMSGGRDSDLLSCGIIMSLYDP